MINNHSQPFTRHLTTIHNHLQPFTINYKTLTTIHNHLQPFTIIYKIINKDLQSITKQLKIIYKYLQDD